MSSPVRLPAGVAWPLVTGVAFYAAAAGVIGLTRGVDGMAAMWPANGILLAALLIAPPRHAWRYAAAVALASLAANVGAGVGPIRALGFTISNVAEALIAWQLGFARNRRLPSFVGVTHVARFFIAAWVAALASATLATLFDLDKPLDFWASWVTTDLLGLLIVTPAIVTACAFARERRRRLVKALGEAAALLAGVAAVAIMAFGQNTYPLLFLPLAALLLATLRLGPFGAAGSVVVIAAIGTGFTFADTGPMSLTADQGSVSLLLFFQFYLLVLLATSLPLAALLAARDDLVRRLAESNRLLHLAERSAGLGHWWLSSTGQGSFYSAEVMRIHGHAETGPVTMAQLLASYHRDDRGRVARLIHQALRDGIAFDFEARIITPAGEERRIHSFGTPDRSEDGAMIGLFGTLQDVTRQVQDQRALEAARSAAEQAALLATTAAETDALTGVANRRKIAALLDEAIVAARTHRHALSVAMLDLDHFKKVNDRFGHLVGDRVLSRVARIASGSLRGADVVGRMGGEEFILLLPTADADQAIAIAERVRIAIAAAGKDDDRLPAVTASVGVATLAPDEDAAALLHRADCALYEAKRAGRNMLRHAA